MASRLAFPKEARIRRRAEYLSMQRQGRRRHTAHLVVITRPAPGGTARLGVTVSSRVGNAVVRNRLKRVIREVFRQSRPDLAPAEDILVIAKPGAHILTHAQAATEFAHAIAPAARS